MPKAPKLTASRDDTSKDDRWFDRFQAGAAAGAIASLVAAGVHGLLTAFGVGGSFLLMAGDILIHGHPHNLEWWLLAFAAHLALGAGFGVGYAYIAQKQVRREWLRGALYGGAVWYVSTVVGHLMNLKPLTDLHPFQILALIPGDVGFGITLAYLVPILGERFFQED